jgi:hypothetical protein
MQQRSMFEHSGPGPDIQQLLSVTTHICVFSLKNQYQKPAMKKIFTILLAGTTTLASAQKEIDLSKSIEDDGHKLSVRINETIDGTTIYCERTFVVTGLEATGLVTHILDSLGGGNMQPPAPPRPPARQLAAASDRHAPVAKVDSDGKCETTQAQIPFSKRVKFNEVSGELYLRYQFVKKGEEFVYEKTVQAGSKSARQRNSIIRDFEREINLPVQ